MLRVGGRGEEKGAGCQQGSEEVGNFFVLVRTVLASANHYLMWSVVYILL